MIEVFDKKRLSICVMCAVLICNTLCSCESVKSGSEFEKPNSRTDFEYQQTKRESKSQTKFINFDGILFQCNLPSVSNIEGTAKPAIVLQEEKDKPDSVRPQYILLELKGEYAEQHKNSFSLPEVEIYPIEDFRQVLSKSESYVKQFNEEIDYLKEILAKKNSGSIKKLPRIPFFDGTAAIKSKIKYISFKNGEGLLYITQYNLDFSLINNEGLIYVFQGITSDNRYYIFGTFPVRLDFLPTNYKTYKFQDYELPEYFLDPKNIKKNSMEYVKYLSLIEKRIDRTDSDSFSPKLTEIEKCISSLEVNWNR